MKNIDWQWYNFAELPLELLYAILRLRQQVFVVEQRCAYLDCDGEDQHSLHLVGRLAGAESSEPIAYLRLLHRHHPDESLRLGRILNHSTFRGQGIGNTLLEEGLRRCSIVAPMLPIGIAAQQHLCSWYHSFGFQTVSTPYDEDGILHVEMVRPPLSAR